MSEFPFRRKPSDAAAEAPDEQEGRDTRTLVVASALGVAVLAAGAFFLLGSGSDEDADTGVVASANRPEATTAVPAPAATATAAPAPSALPPASAVTPGRNPFKALYVIPAGSSSGAATGDATGTDPVGGAPTAAVDGASTPVAPAAPAPAPSEAAPSEPTAEAYDLKLVSSVTGEQGAVRVTWQVDGLTQIVVSGERFGKAGELVVLGTTARGDATDVTIQVRAAKPFVVRQGETVQIV